MSDLVRVRMLTDWPPDEPQWRVGEEREVDAERAARLIADGNAADPAAAWMPEVEARIPDAPEPPARRTPRRGRS